MSATKDAKEPSARVFLLGRFGVEVKGRPIPASSWRKRRPIEVLAALALAPGGVLHREELIDRLWPEKDLEAGANNMHRALHDLRRVTDTDIVGLDRGVARLAENVWVDVDAFERAAAGSEKETLARAVGLYQGVLLPDDPYSDALAARREGLRQRFVDVGLRLAKLHHEASDHEACIDVLRRVLAHDAALEPAHRLLMRVLAESGRKSDALRQFAECSTALRARLDAAPSRETSELRAEIERGDIGATRSAPASSPPPNAAPASASPPLPVSPNAPDPFEPLHGRASETTALREFVAAGRGVLLVVGEAGLGKTRLVRECARIASAAGGAVLLGLSLDQDSGVPYAPFADAWAHHRRATAASPESDPFLSFAPSGASAQEDRLRLFQSVERAVEAIGKNGPVCLVIEDLHQADQSSLHLFHHLARATRTMPLLLVGTLREEEVQVGRAIHTMLGGLTRERLATRLGLRRLDRDATARFVAQLMDGAADASIVDAVHALAEGNPFHTEEVLQAMREEATTRPTLPPKLLDTVRHRVRRLGRDAERLLTAAALVGLTFPFDVAQRASGLTPEAALDALELGIEARIVEESTGEYRFRHALTRQALLDALTHARRVYLHRAIADAMETVSESARRELEKRAETLAFHHESAGQLDRALPYLLAAGERAQTRLGFTESVAFFERAIAMMDATGREDGAERFRVLRMLGGMRMALSDLDGAVRDLDAAAALEMNGFRPSATETALVKRIAALALIQGGRLTEAGQRLEDAVVALDSSHEDPELPAVLYLFAQLRWHEEKYDQAKELADRSLLEATARANRNAMAKAHEMLALACHSLGAWQEGNAHEAERQALTDGTLDVDQAFDVHLCLWEYHLYGEQGTEKIRTTVDQTLDQGRRMNAPRAMALCESFAGTLDFQKGDWSAAEAQLRQAIERFRQVGSASGEALSLQRLAVLLTARGALEDARALLDEGIVVGGRAAMRSHCLTRIHASLTRNRLAANDRDGARASLDEGLAEAARHGHCATCNALLLPEAVRVELAWGDAAAAERYAARLEEVAARFGSRAWTAMAEQARGRVLGARGDVEKAVLALERAGKTYTEIGFPYEAARCALLESTLLESGSPKNKSARARAAAVAEEAKRAFATLGAAGVES
jgi:DNA-binding SARP family transcriptional activator/tetratricopeptide (TPR) repeat protein